MAITATGMYGADARACAEAGMGDRFFTMRVEKFGGGAIGGNTDDGA